MNDAVQAVYTRIARNCQDLIAADSGVIGINGLDCSGKTFFACGLAAFLRDGGTRVHLVHIDDYNDAAVQDEIYTAFASGPCTPALVERFYTGSIDYARAARGIRVAAAQPGIAVVEGVFLFKRPLVGLFDYRIYLDIDPDIGRTRYAARRLAEGDARPVSVFESLWLPAHRCYVAECAPHGSAHCVVDNNRWDCPAIHPG